MSTLIVLIILFLLGMFGVGVAVETDCLPGGDQCSAAIDEDAWTPVTVDGIDGVIVPASGASIFVAADEYWTPTETEIADAEQAIADAQGELDHMRQYAGFVEDGQTARSTSTGSPARVESTGTRNRYLSWTAAKRISRRSTTLRPGWSNGSRSTVKRSLLVLVLVFCQPQGSADASTDPCFAPGTVLVENLDGEYPSGGVLRAYPFRSPGPVRSRWCIGVVARFQDILARIDGTSPATRVTAWRDARCVRRAY